MRTSDPFSLINSFNPALATGIRSALTFAKALKLTTNLNVFGLSKFELINYRMGLSKIKKTKCIILHFRNNEFFKLLNSKITC